MKSTIRYFGTIAIFLTNIFYLSAQNLDILQRGAKNKIDPLLQHALSLKAKHPTERMQFIETYPAGNRLSESAGDVVGVLIHSSENIREYVKSIGGVIGSRHGEIYTALIPMNSIAQLADYRSVNYIEASRILYPTLDLSRVKTGADVLQAFPDIIRRLTGKGIIIGFTDTGIDTYHSTFRTSEDKTRVLYVWDQYADFGGSPPAGFSYGVEKDSADINANLWHMTDEWGEHGTIVSGIAAGNGLPSRKYIGMAPEADIIMVSNFVEDLFDRGLSTVGTLDGYDYIRTKAQALGKRYVINTSQGTNLGPHDGTTLFEQAINADVADGAVICLATGNEGISSRHASAIVPVSSPVEVECSVTSNVWVNYEIPMDIWYNGNDRLVLKIKKAADTGYVAIFPPVDSTISYTLDSIIVSATTKIGSSLNGDNQIYLTINPMTSYNTWRIQLQFSAAPGNTLPDGGRVDLWWERNYTVNFLTHVDQSVTLGMPSCADSAITATSYNNRSYWGAEDDISTYSGRGPRRDGFIKPDISAIGGVVTSSIPFNGYDTFGGTSMAAPHVAGAVALLLQQDTSLTSYQIKQKLLASATEDAFTGTVPNSTWGYGKLNILKAAGYDSIRVIGLSKDTIWFNPAFTGMKNDDTVEVLNTGNETLTISSLSTSDTLFALDKSSVTLPPRSQDRFIVSITPADTGTISGIVTIVSNDPVRPTIILNIVGYTSYPPSIAISPDSLSVTLGETDSSTQMITISNDGTGPLSWQYGLTSMQLTGIQTDNSIGQNPESRWIQCNGIQRPDHHNMPFNIYNNQEIRVRSSARKTTQQSTGSGPIFPLFGATQEGIHQVDPVTGALLRTYPFELSGGPDGLAFDGSSLYVLSGNDSFIYKTNYKTGAITDSIIITSLPSRTVDGLATDGVKLYISDYDTPNIYALDIGTKSLVATLNLPFSIGGGIAYSLQRGSLFVSGFSTAIYEINASSGAILRQFSTPLGTTIFGVAYSNSADLLIVCDDVSIYFLDPNTGDIIRSIAGGYSGLAADEVNNGSFTLEPDAGTIAPQSFQNVSVQIKTLKALPGIRNYIMSILSSDPYNKRIDIPITVEVTEDPGSSVSDNESNVPKVFTLFQNYPNPFNPVTTIEFQIPPSPFYKKGERGGFVSLKIYDLLGREVATLVNERKSAGSYSVQWDASQVPSGVYFYRIQAGKFKQTKKMVLMK